MYNNTFIKNLLDKGGDIAPLVIPSKLMKGVTLLNPSIINNDGKLIVNLRNCNYTLWHTDLGQPFENQWGPLVYLNPENDLHLKTENILIEINDDLSIVNDSATLIDMKLNVSNPLWEFHGLEDARLVKWEEKLYLCGVRRDTTENGQGRMELSEIYFNGSTYEEIKRYRIPSPGKNDSYCEKNWMPILDKPFHFIKWSDPTEIVYFDIHSNMTTVANLQKQSLPLHNDFRGSSQVLTLTDDKKIAIVHETKLFTNELGRKNAIYEHRFIIWDKDWNIIKVTDPFSFMGFDIEFCCGLALKNNYLYIPFSCQDNMAFICKIPLNQIIL